MGGGRATVLMDTWHTGYGAVVFLGLSFTELGLGFLTVLKSGRFEVVLWQQFDLTTSRRV